MGHTVTTETDCYVPGDFNATCFECGRKFKASQLKKHWQGYFVCPDHWEIRHPQDFVRNVADNMGTPWAQPLASNFITGVCTFAGRVSVADWAIADCAIANYIPPGFTPNPFD